MTDANEIRVIVEGATEGLRDAVAGYYEACRDTREARLDLAAAYEARAEAITDRAERRWWWPRLTMREIRQVAYFLDRASMERAEAGSAW